MKFKITYHKDVLGNNYLAIDVPKSLLSKYFVEMREDLHDLTVFDRYVINKDKRDHNLCHLTVINVMDLNMLIDKYKIDKSTEIVEQILDLDLVDLKFMGLGTASKGENTTYFVVVKSDTINTIRRDLSLSEIDPHITLGFEFNDVFGVPKNEVMEHYSEFKRTLSTLFYSNNESFNFIRSMDSYNFGSDPINAVFIGNTWANFRIGELRMITLSLVDDKITITNSWEETKTKPILSHTIIYKKLKSK